MQLDATCTDLAKKLRAEATCRVRVAELSGVLHPIWSARSAPSLGISNNDNNNICSE